MTIYITNKLTVIGEHIYVLKMIPLQNASIYLRRVYAHNFPLSSLPEFINNTWFPNLRETQVILYIIIMLMAPATQTYKRRATS